MSGIVYLVGAGPGAPDLITLRAARLLAEADIVFHDALVHADVVALAARAEKIAVGKRCGRHSTAQRFINKRLVDAARVHRVVVRLKGGDPLLFGRAQEELGALAAAGVRCEIVPGISAAFAASAALGVSLTERGVARSVVFATPRIGEEQSAASSHDWSDAALGADTAALYMAGEHAREIAAQLVAHGKPAATPVVAVTSASLPEQSTRATTLGELAHGEPEWSSGPTLLLVGEVYAAHVARTQRANRRAARARA